ncbi:Serine protease snake [Frankliniella fusca]|uniref:Serine protease snake n=1 Tax=Frankliniella fusca TaxID=407009 RepID=A0AAE1LQ84_9NEOP|nr:Serine protease snake [Frankliniella fusca]
MKLSFRRQVSRVQHTTLPNMKYFAAALLLACACQAAPSVDVALDAADLAVTAARSGALLGLEAGQALTDVASDGARLGVSAAKGVADGGLGLARGATTLTAGGARAGVGAAETVAGLGLNATRAATNIGAGFANTGIDAAQQVADGFGLGGLVAPVNGLARQGVAVGQNVIGTGVNLGQGAANLGLGAARGVIGAGENVVRAGIGAGQTVTNAATNVARSGISAAQTGATLGVEAGKAVTKMASVCRKHQEELCKLPQKLSVPACPANAEPADILEFPHMALLGYGDRDNIEYACGGSLIAADFILTAAHCANLAGRPVGWALLGATNRTSQQPKASDTFQLIQVAEVIVHPEYVVQFKYHDIALLRLVRPAVMRRDGVYPACLNTDMDVDNTGQDAVATGWGATSFADEGSQSLLKVNLTLREMQYCRDNIELDKAKVPRGLLDETQLCAGGGEHNRDTCQGDSGGPLQMRADPSNRVTCIYRIVGVVSFGPPCGLGKPGVYSRVAAYVPWIESVVWPTRPDGCVNNVLIKSGGDLEVRLPNTGPGTVARGMCRVFHTKFCGYYMASIRNVKPELTFDSACHHNHPRAERGSSTEDHDVVTFVYGDSPYNKRHNCAGALVSPNTVLTAARCVSMGCLPLKKVYVGPPNACSERGPAAVEKVTLHPDYREGRAYADLAVIKLKMSFDLRDFLPRCLNTMADVPVRAGLRATGASYNIIGTWEDMELDKPNSTLSVRSAEQCSAALLGNDRLRQALPRGYSPSLLCAGGLCDNETYAMSPPPSLLLLLLAALLLAAGACAASDGPVDPAACGAAERCVPLTRCPSALQDMQLERPLRPRPCGFEDGTTRVPNVCCRGAVVEPPAKLACPEPAPPLSPVPDVTCEKFVNSLTDEDDARPGKLARRMCRKHQEELCKLPKKHDQSVCPAGAQPADILEFPHMALLGYGDRDNIEYACGGSLIAADFILTAAHCASLAGTPVGWALLGATNRTSQQPKANDTFQLIQVAEVIVHPEYVAQVKYHDIALLRLARPAAMRMEDVYPACLNTDIDVDNTGQDAVATGWGATSFADEGSQSLLKVNLTLREMQYCRDNLELDNAKVPRGLSDETQLCAGGGEHNRDTCQGDSGGPLQMRADPGNSVTCIYRIVGVVSFGPPCGLGKPGVYTRVAAYVPWIESVVWPTRPDGCVNNVRIKSGDSEVRVPNTGPGTVARGMCRVFHTEYCGNYWPRSKHVKPELTLDSACHHNYPRDGHVGDAHRVVTFLYGDSPYNKRHNCAGALVSPNTVLTAARCVSMGCLPLKMVAVGSPSDCNEPGRAAVDKITVHPDYRAGRAYADLAVIKMNMSFDLRDFLPLCLNTVADVPVRAGLRATGASYNIIGTWEDMGLVKPNNTLSVRSAEQCSAALLGNDRLRQALPRGYSPSLLCAGGLCDNETYAGDPGTPLVSFQHRLMAAESTYYVDYVLGVASSLTYCTARGPGGLPLPDLFADVAQNIEWIENTVWPDEAD